MLLFPARVPLDNRLWQGPELCALVLEFQRVRALCADFRARLLRGSKPLCIVDPRHVLLMLPSAPRRGARPGDQLDGRHLGTRQASASAGVERASHACCAYADLRCFIFSLRTSSWKMASSSFCRRNEIWSSWCCRSSRSREANSSAIRWSSAITCTKCTRTCVSHRLPCAARVPGLSHGHEGHNNDHSGHAGT